MERITLDPVDGVHVTTLMDNSSDVLMPDEGLVRPHLVVPAHCTGWKAQHAMVDGLPEAFRRNSVGSRFEL